MRRAWISAAVAITAGAAVSAAAADEIVIGFPSYTCENYESACKTEAEKAERRRKREEQQRRQAERDRAAAEAETVRKAEVDSFTSTYGDHRAAEAEKLRNMRLKAEAASGLKTPAPAQKCEPSYTASYADALARPSEADARALAQSRFDAHQCTRNGGQAVNVQPMRCTSAKHGLSPEIKWTCTINFTCKTELKSCGKGGSRQ